MIKLVLLRHGESIWNRTNKFTGWTDVDLSDRGIIEAENAAKTLISKNYIFNKVYTSVLRRSIRTTWIVLDKMNLMYIPVCISWRLNERMYGALQGLNKSDMAKKYGEEQVFTWRRSYDVRPPLLKTTNPGHPIHDQKYSNVKVEYLPSGESLRDTYERVMPYWQESVVPELKDNNQILISAHGNSIRAIVKKLDNISDLEITKTNIPTGIPLVYELTHDLLPIRHYFLGDPKDIQKALLKIENQGRIKT